MFTTFTDLARLCRICLRHLRDRDTQCPDPRIIAILQKLLDIDILQQPQGFPTEICNLCHNAVVYFEELRQVARESSQKLIEWQPVDIAVDRVKEEPPYDGLGENQEEDQQELQEEHEKRADGQQVDLPEKQEDQKEILDDRENEEYPDEYENSQQQLSQGSGSKRRAGLACDQCGKQVYKLPYLEAHIRSVHQGYSKPFLCRSCDKCFTRYEQLRSHMRNAHPQLEQLQQELRDLICELCNRQYSTKNALGEHLKRHAQRKEHVCEHCGVAKVTRTELLTHLRTHNPTWERFKCEQCPQLFRHKSAISRHVRVVHEGQRRFQCGHCEKKFGTHASQVRHERLHTESTGSGEAAEEWPFACIHCQKPCVSRQTLELHLRRHRARKTHRKRREQSRESQEQEQEHGRDQHQDAREAQQEQLRKRKKLRQRDLSRESHRNEATTQANQWPNECQQGQESHDPEPDPLEGSQCKLEQEDALDPEWQHKIEQDAESQDSERPEGHFHDYKLSPSEA
ncbi:zinc finger protein 84 [Drosophila mauritiana]|uniref:Zinc finger protein 84 n=1 Tax=Drosophila mauritiana TaxID=7226 RepID=A0A6P8KII3_DROMA|nr:zinc finger protein 84 [Drosophila mauritiana]